MPTTRTRRRRNFQPTVSATQWALLTDQPLDEIEPGLDQDFERWCFNWLDDSEPPWRAKTGRQLWVENCDAVLEEWIPAHPGSRPSTWWRFAAPAPRQRVGGVGTPKSELLANAPRFWCGVPLDWVSRWEVEYYNGRATDIHGNPISTNHREGEFKEIAINPQNPPTYESQASFLDRYGLLLPGERRRICDADFRPVKITDILDLGPME